MQSKQIYFILFFLCIIFNSIGQVQLDELDLARISQEKIHEYVGMEKEQNIHTFLEIEPSMLPNSSVKGYKIQEDEYFFKENLNKVWKHYVHTSPAKSWNGKKVSFGFLFSKKEDKIIYKDEPVSKIDTGQIVYLNLKLMRGLKNLATAFEFITIDKEKRIIEFSYLKGQLSEGKQRLEFYETPRGNTRILHTSFYKSGSTIRNHILYPFFHTRATNEFHRNMKKQMLED